jgi:ubiquinone/menaquinone biosynthesis C-methylase UbiE
VATDPQPQLFDLFDWSTDATVLDVGCGNGLWTSIAAHRTADGTVIGLDRSHGMLSAVATRPEPILVLLADGQQLPVRSNTIDVVLATWVLYHLTDKAAAFSEILRVLGPDGRLIASTNSVDVLPTVDDLFRASVERVARRSVRHWIEPLDFTIENGADQLGQWFEQVDTVISESRFEIPEPEPLVAYAESLREPILAEVGDDFDFDAFLGILSEALQQRLASGPIRFTRRVGYFEASTSPSPSI